jgi:hypothetical protein
LHLVAVALMHCERHLPSVSLCVEVRCSVWIVQVHVLSAVVQMLCPSLKQRPLLLHQLQRLRQLGHARQSTRTSTHRA